MSWNGLPTVTLIDGSEAVLVEDLRKGPGLREALEFVVAGYHDFAIGDERVTPLHPAVSWENCPNLACAKARAALAATEEPGLERPTTRLYMTAEDIEAALSRLRGPVDRDEATVMAAAQAAADALRGNLIVAARQEARDGE